MTADTSNTWWLPWRHWWQYRKVYVTPKQHRSSAPELPRLTRCGTVVRFPATLWPCRGSAGSVTRGFNSPPSFGRKVRALAGGPATRGDARETTAVRSDTAQTKKP